MDTESALTFLRSGTAIAHPSVNRGYYLVYTMTEFDIYGMSVSETIIRNKTNPAIKQDIAFCASSTLNKGKCIPASYISSNEWFIPGKSYKDDFCNNPLIQNAKCEEIYRAKEDIFDNKGHNIEYFLPYLPKHNLQIKRCTLFPDDGKYSMISLTYLPIIENSKRSPNFYRVRKDMNTDDVEAVMKMVAGTARSMGVEIQD